MENEMTHEAIESAALIKAWLPFRKALGFSSLRTQRDYKRAMTLIDMLVDEIGEDESHPLADLLDHLSSLVVAYESANVEVPDAHPREVLRFLMEQHGLSQSDLKDCAPQSRISEILNGRRDISKELAKVLAKRFGVGVGVFV
jgi:HTH-type transcriptional regulator / antitoxin HigA